MWSIEWSTSARTPVFMNAVNGADNPMYVCMYQSMYVCMHACMYGMYVCVYVRTYVARTRHVCISRSSQTPSDLEQERLIQYSFPLCSVSFGADSSSCDLSTGSSLCDRKASSCRASALQSWRPRRVPVRPLIVVPLYLCRVFNRHS